MSILLKDAHKINEKQITSEDVSAEYVDSRSRLEAKKQVRFRYLELLKGAKNMSDITEVAAGDQCNTGRNRNGGWAHKLPGSFCHYEYYSFYGLSNSGCKWQQ